MSLQDLISKNLALIRNVIKKPAEQAEIREAVEGTAIEEEAAKKIILRQEPKSKKGLKRNAIMAIIAGCAVIMVTMIVAGMMSSGDRTASEDQQQKERDVAASSPNLTSPADDLPSTYSSYGDYTQQKNASQAKQGNQQVLQQPVEPAYYPPQIQDSGYRSSYSSNNSYPDSYSGSYAGQPSASYSPDRYDPYSAKNEYTKSAIRFMNGSSAPAQGGGSPDMNHVSAGSDIDAGTTYYKKTAPNTLLAGTVIPATLITGINSDVGGDIVAQVRQDIYDSITGQTLLIPQGARLIGTYGSNVTMGQKRLKAVFTRIILPNGYSFNLDNQKATDGGGYPGLVDKVDTHSSSVYKAAFLTSIFAALASSASGGQGSDNRSPGQEAVSGAISNILNTAGQITQKSLNVSPTITIRPGTEFAVFLNKDICLKEYIRYAR